MKRSIMKIFAVAALMIFIGAGVSLADDRWHHRGQAYGHYKHRVQIPNPVDQIGFALVPAGIDLAFCFEPVWKAPVELFIPADAISF